MRRATPWTVAALALLGNGGAAAQEAISSDRPGLGDGAYVLSHGVWQVEAGVQVSGDDPRQIRVGQALVRWGLGRFEARFHLNSVVFDRTAEPDVGAEDVAAGFKVALNDGAGGWSWSVTGAVSGPVGGDPFSAGDPTGSAALVGETSLSENVGLAVNGGYAAPFGGGGDGTVSVIVTPTFAVPSKGGLSWYAGYAGFFTPGEDAHFAEGGVAWLAGPDVQWDLNAGYDVDGGGWFFGVGVARRLPAGGS